MADAPPPAAHRRPLPWFVRWLVKCGVLALVLLLVLFPDPRRLPTHLRRVSNFNALKQPDHAEIVRLADRFLAGRAAATQPASSPARDEQLAAQRFIYENVAYMWDWDQWGPADYVPTLDEMAAAAAGRPDRRLAEDCDGRAVVCASLLERLGYPARIVSDLKHVWVETAEGPLMGPGGRKAVVSDEKGTRIHWLAAVESLPRSLSYGIAVFPWGRELIVWLTIVLLSIHPRMHRRVAVIGIVLTLQGWLFLRAGVITRPDGRWLDQTWTAWVGLANLAAGLYMLWRASSKARRAANSEGRE